jgi:hypothetical protein
LALANQAGTKYRIGVAATMRPYKNEPFIKSAFYGGSRRNIRNNGGKCLDVHGKSDTHNRHCTFWNCHNGLNQAWLIDRKGIKYNRYPLKDGILFQIKSAMKGRRALKMHEHIGGGQFRLRIQNNNAKDNKQWFVFDWRSKTIRASSNRKLVLANQKGTGFRIGVAATVRPYLNSYYQRSHWFGGSRRNIRNNGGKCLDVHGGSNTHMRHVIFWNCHNGLNQSWTVDRTLPKKIVFPPYPLGDRVKFQLKSRMTGNRALFWNNHIGGNRFRTYIQDNNPEDKRQWFTFDSRTKTIRAWAKRGHALSTTGGFKRGGIVVI